jgi:phage protein D
MSATIDAIPIFAGGRDFYVPAFQVKLRGRPLGQDVVRDIVQVSYKDSLTDIDSFEISINNWDADKRQFKYTDLDLFDPGKQLELWMGYHGRDPLRLMISGEITSLRPNYPATGQPTLAVSGLNLLHRLRVKQESSTYENMTETEIATQVANRLGFKLLPDPPPAGEKPNKFVFQYDEYDIIFLMERARRVGYDIYVKEIEQNGKAESRLYFGPSDTSRRPTYELVFGKSLVEFQPELTTHRQVGKVTVRGWDAVKKEKIEVTVKRNELTEDGLDNEGGLEAVVQSFGDREEIVADEPVPNAEEARKKAISKFKEIARNMVTGNGSTLGLPDLRAGSHVFIDKLGDRFKGNYFVTATTHTISDGGYVTGFECRREEPKK